MSKIHKHSIYDTDLHFIIDPITRKISSESGKVTLMQNDHNSERFTFEIPRYIEGHDMSICNEVQVHYINVDGSNKRNQHADIYIVDDVQKSPDSEEVVIGSWLISNCATQYAGTLNFVLRFVCYGEESEITYQWFSDIFDKIKITSGIYNIDVIVDEQAVDILECWKRDVIAAFEESDVYSTVLKNAQYAADSAEEVKKTVETLADKAAANPRGDYKSSETYNIMDLVTHNNKLWMPKHDDINGIEPTSENSEHWWLLIELTPITKEEIDALEPLVPSEDILDPLSESELDEIIK